jgi:hypothetical protein
MFKRLIFISFDLTASRKEMSVSRIGFPSASLFSRLLRLSSCFFPALRPVYVFDHDSVDFAYRHKVLEARSQRQLAVSIFIPTYINNIF